MITYTTLCANNRRLYGQLERLTLQIRAYESVNNEAMVKMFQEQKDVVQRRIDTNLEILEELWQNKRPVDRIPESERGKYEEAQIVDLYKENPTVGSLPAIAKKYGFPIETVCKIISAHLSKQDNK